MGRKWEQIKNCELLNFKCPSNLWERKEKTLNVNKETNFFVGLISDLFSTNLTQVWLGWAGNCKLYAPSAFYLHPS